MVADRPAGRREIAAVQVGGDGPRRADETPEREQACEGECLEKDAGDPESLGERRHRGAGSSGDRGDADRDRDATGQECRR